MRLILQSILNRVKNPFYPFDGTSGFDLDFFLYDNIKWLNLTDVEYKGILYSHEKQKSDLHVYQRFISNIFNDYYFAHKKIFIIAYATGQSVLKPEDWYMIFVDFKSKFSIFIIHWQTKINYARNLFSFFLHYLKKSN